MLRPTFLSFETAKRAINVSQLGLDTVGHNISNVNTPGYTRQRVDQLSLSLNGVSTKYKVHGANGQSPGLGVLYNGTSQIRDSYLDTRYRNEASTYGELAVKAAGLQELESIDEISADGLNAKMLDFINELTKYASGASDVEIAAAVRNMAKQVTQVMNKASAELENILNNQKEDLRISITDDINTTLESIAYLNERIRQEHMTGNPANELMDDRNLLIDKLSEFVNIKVVNTPEKISGDLTISRLSIVMVDSTTSPASEFTLVDNKEYNALGMRENADGTVSIDLLEGYTMSPLKKDITGAVTKGAVKGYIDIINGSGDFAGRGDNSFRGVPYYMNMLDTYAATFAKYMNECNSITAADAAAANSPFVKEYDPKNLFVSSDGGNITAKNIRLSQEWESESTFLTTSKMAPSTADPEPVLKDGKPVYDDQGNQVFKDNANADNINKFVNMLKGDMTFASVNRDNERIVLYTGGASEYMTSLMSTRGLDYSLNNTLLLASDKVISGHADSRDAISAVSVDEEAINMMTYQNYYNAAVRYMTTLDEALNQIISGMGLVGR